MEDPIKWLNHLSDVGLKKWLRDAVWQRDCLPISVPPSSSLGVYLSDVFNNPNASLLRLRLREIIPSLLQEWGRFDPPKTLADLLYLCGTLRCAAAEPIIISIAREHLYELSEEVSLRQVCLSVLSGLGPSEATRDLFKYYLRDARYTALCYRGLYRLRLSYAAVELPTVLDVYRESGGPNRATIVAKRFFFEYLKPNQHADVIRVFLRDADPKAFEIVLHFLRSIDVLNERLWREATPSERIEFLKIILERAEPESVQGMFEILKSIGGLNSVSFRGVSLRQKFQAVKTFLRRGLPDSFKSILQALKTTNLFGLSLFLEVNPAERVELMSLLLNRMKAESFQDIQKFLNLAHIDLDLVTTQNESEKVVIRYGLLGPTPVELEDTIPAVFLRAEITDQIFRTSRDNSARQLDKYFSEGPRWKDQRRVELAN